MNLAGYVLSHYTGMGTEMTNFLISLILGLWLLVVVAFYAFVVGAALCRILAGFRHAIEAFARSSDLRLVFPSGWRRLSFPSHPLKMTTALVMVGILVLLSAGFVRTASSLIRYCGLILLVIVPSAWILVQHFKE
jgi:hypothetical protein